MGYYDLKKLENTGEDKTALEKKHVPYIQCPDKVQKGEYFEVTVTFGKEITHPMGPDHYIQYFDLYANYASLARVDFTPDMKAEATLTLKLEESCDLNVYAFCNLHDHWEGSKSIEVVE
ncbi:superoxide reductase [Halanaerobium saccharolyticum]|uniref:Superoxide reductase n=1 Tax=Halanaerobium saccharolyticum TaxID=43595 RepID=A0A4R7Z834_9FIRM|nr:desulfoferrodoxin family protein [Halanaerobium saccharolyticum]RAK11913.1 superoxide reductase [Halanaerobium saccharolyticum]TDW07754.1 superoxide reductase [Halanaerobium saccharolyticum]TDX64675.1 superoxide reductase [Halanaerobium saccharolyticum]